MQVFDTIRRTVDSKRVAVVDGYFRWEYTTEVTYVTLDEAVQELAGLWFAPHDEYVEVTYSAQNGQNVPAMRDLFDRAEALARSVGDESRFEELYIL